MIIPPFQKVKVISVGKPFQEIPSTNQWTIVIEIRYNEWEEEITLRQVGNSEMITAYFRDGQARTVSIQSTSICDLEDGNEIEIGVAL
jgi:DsbC/DsbD-like thiol-disulfide interchange protein